MIQQGCPPAEEDVILLRMGGIHVVDCWECGAMTSRPTPVIIGTPARIIGRLELCPACYVACYRPLAQHPTDPASPVHALLIVTPDRAGAAVGA